MSKQFIFNQGNLANLRVLVTRPEQQAKALCQLIAQKGGNAIALPTIAIQFITAAERAELRDLSKNLPEQSIAIFISSNAVQAMQALLQECKLSWPKNLKIAAVGASTAQALTANGMQVDIMPSQFNSEALLALPALKKVAGQKIIIFKGEGGRELLRDTLLQRGALVTEALIYRRRLPRVDIQSQLQAWQAGGLDIIVCTSNTGLQHLLNMVGPAARDWLLQMPLLVISARMQQFAQDLGFVKVPIVADNAADAAIVQTLLDHYTVNKKLNHL